MSSKALHIGLLRFLVAKHVSGGNPEMCCMKRDCFNCVRGEIMKTIVGQDHFGGGLERENTSVQRHGDAPQPPQAPMLHQLALQ